MILLIKFSIFFVQCTLNKGLCCENSLSLVFATKAWRISVRLIDRWSTCCQQGSSSDKMFFKLFGGSFMRKIVLGIFFSLIAICSFAQDSPLENYKYRHSLYDGVELMLKDGTKTIFESVEEEYNETDGWAYIKGYGKIHYWLYDTAKNADGLIVYGVMGRLVYAVLPEWVEKMGYAIDFDHVRDIDNDQDTPSSVKKLMEQRGCNVAAALITSDTSYPYGKSPYLVIHWRNKEDDIYSTYIYPLY